MGTGEWAGGWIGRCITYSVPSLSSTLSDTGTGMMSPFTVLPLHRDCLDDGVSQLDQSSSSSWSKVSGVQEKCFRVLVTAAAGAAGSVALEDALARFCCCCWSRSFSRSLKLLLEEKPDLMGVLVSELVSAGNGRSPRLVMVVDTRIVLLSSPSPPLALFNLDAMSEFLPLNFPDIASSPTVACRRSSTNVQRPCLKSFAICFIPFCGCACRGAQVARLLMAAADLGFQSGCGAGDESIDLRVSFSSGTGNSVVGLVGESSDSVRVCPPRMTLLLCSRGAA